MPIRSFVFDQVLLDVLIEGPVHGPARGRKEVGEVRLALKEL